MENDDFCDDEYAPDPCPRCGKSMESDGVVTFDVNDPFGFQGMGYIEEWCSADHMICGHVVRHYENGQSVAYLYGEF